LKITQSATKKKQNYLSAPDAVIREGGKAHRYENNINTIHVTPGMRLNIQTVCSAARFGTKRLEYCSPVCTFENALVEPLCERLRSFLTTETDL